MFAYFLRVLLEVASMMPKSRGNFIWVWWGSREFLGAVVVNYVEADHFSGD